MTKDEIYKIKNKNLVLLLDGRIGMLIRYPSTDTEDTKCGVQVCGEEEIRWINCNALVVIEAGRYQNYLAQINPVYIKIEGN